MGSVLTNSTSRAERGSLSRKAAARAVAEKGIPPIVLSAGVLVLWQLSAELELINPLLLPPPSAVLSATIDTIIDVATGGRVTVHFLVTLNEIVVGFVVATVIGCLIGALMSESERVSRALYPYVVSLNSTPKIALAPIFVVWFGYGQLPKIVLVVLISIFPVIIGAMVGLRSTDAQALRLMRSLDASTMEVLSKVKLRAALPFLFAGLEVAITSASIGAIVGEFIGGNRGLGYVAILAQEVIDVERTFAIVLVLGIQGIVLHRLVVFARNRIVFWESA